MGVLNNTKAIIGYHYPTGKWDVLGLVYGPLATGAGTYEKCQSNKLIYTLIIEVPIKSIDNEGVTICDDFNLPLPLTLEQSIKNNKKQIEKYLSEIN